jgi:integrase
VEFIPQKTKKERPITVSVPLNAKARAIVDKYKPHDGKFIFPFISHQKYNYAIKDIFTLSNITRSVVVLNPETRQQEIKPINQIASSHMARKFFIGNIYNKVQDPSLIGSLSGHVSGSKAFARYRSINKDLQHQLVDFLE